MVMDKLLFKSKVEEGNIHFERKSHLTTRTLNYWKELCSGCGMCAEVCPQECIQLNPPSSKDKNPLIVINLDECLLCGVCSEVCLFNAIEVSENGEPIKNFEGNPRYSLIYEVDTNKCPPDCNECEKACPRGAINCQNGFKRDSTRCVYCTSCAIACPEDAIIVEKVFSGEIDINSDECQACGVCVEVCPTGAIYFPKLELGQDVERIKVDEKICIYCGACEQACPVDVITVSRRNASYSVKGKNPWTKTHEEAFKKLIKR